MNKKPICNNPINGSMETMSGYRLCCNPEHSKEPYYTFNGPVWHLMADWPDQVAIKKAREAEARAHIKSPKWLWPTRLFWVMVS